MIMPMDATKSAANTLRTGSTCPASAPRTASRSPSRPPRTRRADGQPQFRAAYHQQSAMVTIWYSSGSARADAAREQPPDERLAERRRRRRRTSARRRAASPPRPRPRRSCPGTGSSAKSRPTVQSCRMSVPMVIWPCSVCAPPRSARHLITTAVLDMERNAPEDALLAGRAREVRDDPHQHHERDLHGPAEHRQGLHVPQLREGKLDAGEEQEDDPELRQRLHLHELHDEPEAARPDERARDEVPGDQRLANQREHRRARRGRDQDDHEVADQTQVLLQLHRAGLGVGDDKLVVPGVHQTFDVLIRVLAPERAVDVLPSTPSARTATPAVASPVAFGQLRRRRRRRDRSPSPPPRARHPARSRNATTVSSRPAALVSLNDRPAPSDAALLLVALSNSLSSAFSICAASIFSKCASDSELGAGSSSAREASRRSSPRSAVPAKSASCDGVRR